MLWDLSAQFSKHNIYLRKTGELIGNRHQPACTHWSVWIYILTSYAMVLSHTCALFSCFGVCDWLQLIISWEKPCLQCFPTGHVCVISVLSHFLEDVTGSGNCQHFPYGSFNSSQKPFPPCLTFSLFFSSWEMPISLRSLLKQYIWSNRHLNSILMANHTSLHANLSTFASASFYDTVVWLKYF